MNLLRFLSKWTRKRKLNSLRKGDLFFYQEEEFRPEEFKISLKAGFSPTVISILNQNHNPKKTWGIFNEIIYSQIEDDLLPGSFLCYLRFFNLEKGEEDLISFWSAFKITSYKLRKNSIECKRWFKVNKIAKYLTHDLEYVRLWAKKFL